MIETKTKNIAGKEYQVTQFPALHGLRLAVKIAKILGPALGGLTAEKGVSILDMDTSKLDISAIASGLVGALDEVGTPKLILELLSTTSRDRVLLDDTGFNNAFSANYGELVKAVAFVVEVNYGDFFGVLAAGQMPIGKAPSSGENQT